MTARKLNLNRRLAGILVPVFSIRGERDLGIGDTASLRDLVNFAAETGFGFVQLLPINETGPDNSPYNAISSVAIEPMTLDCTPDGLKDLTPEDFAGVVADYDLAALNEGPVQYATVRELKQRLLKKAFNSFCSKVLGRVDTRAADFEAFCHSESEWLNDYCLFRLLMDREGGSQVWQHWRDEYQDKAKALAAIIAEAKSHPEAIDRELRYYAFVQWVAFSQWREVTEHAATKGVALMGDIPFGVSLYSVDVWADLEIFDLDWYGGAPPETLFKDDEFVQKWGQNWGIPLYRWDVLEGRNFDWWRRRIAKTTEIFGMFRVDHALGFYRIYSFPWNPVRNAEFLPLSHDEAARRCGGRLPGFRPRPDHNDEAKAANRADGEKYLRMILEAADGAEVIAEDLGTVPDYVRPSLAELGIAGMKVPQWEFTDGHVTSGLHYPALSFATYASHDHAPMRAQWEQQRQRMHESGHGSQEWWESRGFLETLCAYAGIERHDGDIPDYSVEVWNSLFRELSMSHSDRIAVMVNDLLMETERINVPGVMDGTNWSYRVPMSARELATSFDYRELRESLKNLLNETGRSRRVHGA
jgi:4-alpha-glucanotransferase